MSDMHMSKWNNIYNLFNFVKKNTKDNIFINNQIYRVLRVPIYIILIIFLILHQIVCEIVDYILYDSNKNTLTCYQKVIYIQ